MLSTRARNWSRAYYLHGEEKTFDPVTNPHGEVWLTNAFNWLIYEDFAAFINEHSQFDKSLCTYGEGYTGSSRLRAAMAGHLNRQFKPVEAIDAEEITFAAGVTDLNEACALLTCNPGEAVMLGRPIYGPFYKDLSLRTGVKLEYVSVGDTDQFTPACVEAYDVGFEAARARGVAVKALVICNPHNPLGHCYPRETLEGLLRLCAEKGIHLISDEIYALSVYRTERCEAETFTSIRAVDTQDIIDPAQVHVLYGMSKDYGAAGLRLGCIVSRNGVLTRAARAISRFSSPSQFSMDLAAKFLEREAFTRKLLEKSAKVLQQARRQAEELLDHAGIAYHKEGNAGLFVWIDLSPWLPLEETDGDSWAAEKVLSQRLRQGGVVMDAGAEYRAPAAGRFRLMFSVEANTLWEGIKRIASVLSSGE